MDGKDPKAALTYDPANGMFYGTTRDGGADVYGTIFKFNPQTHAETLLYSFKGQPGDGSNPDAALTYDPANGMFYGTTSAGGPGNTYGNNYGTLFEFNPQTNTETVVYSFSNSKAAASDGDHPHAALTYDAADGMLYGTTEGGGNSVGYGTIFKFNPKTHAETVVYSFKDQNGDGYYPEVALTYDPANKMFYGTTSGGGASGNILFEFNPRKNAETVVHSFKPNSKDGSRPDAALTYDPADGMLYGTTANGGTNNDGILFKLNPQTHAETVLHDFGGSARSAWEPQAALIYDSANGMFYGTTAGGGANSDGYSINHGTIFQFNPQTNAETIIHSFQNNSKDGSDPEAALTYDPADKMLYGTTTAGGPGSDTSNGGNGTIFTFTP